MMQSWLAIVKGASPVGRETTYTVIAPFEWPRGTEGCIINCTML